jgi:hypothetical protein
MKKSNKHLDTLVPDIYNKISALSKGKSIRIPKKLLDKFSEDMTEALVEWATPKGANKSTTNNLRMSNIGKPDRQLWFDMHEEKDTDSELHPSTLIKFLYGHLLEVLLLFFVRLAGHSVDSEQKEVTVSGIKGHMDCKIDGEVVDIKSASGYAFKKFKEGTLAEQDNFGYLAQLAGYEASEKTDAGGFLVINKETGELTFFQPEDLDKPNIKQRITAIKKAVKKKTPPDFCYPTVPEGKSGNMKLARECTYCPYKYKCHKDSNEGKGLRVFNYAKGPIYFTKVVKVPNVEEVL